MSFPGIPGYHIVLEVGESSLCPPGVAALLSFTFCRSALPVEVPPAFLPCMLSSLELSQGKHNNNNNINIKSPQLL